MLKFENAPLIWLLAVLPLVFFVFFIALRRRRKALNRFASEKSLQNLLPALSVSRPWLRVILQLGTLFFMILAIAGPLIGSRLEEVKREGADLLIAVDVSNSMLAEDLKPNRMEHTRRLISQLIDRLEGDRIGFIVFAGEAYMQLPLTGDYAAARLFLNSINTEIVPVQGTSLAAPIEMAMESFVDTSKKHNALLIISDGENHDEEALEAARRANEKGIRIYTLGVGSESGAPLPIYSNGVRVGFKQDRNGKTIISRMNPQALSGISDAAQGSFTRIGPSGGSLGSVLDELRQLDKKEFKSKVYTDYDNLFQWFLLPALFLMVAEFLLGDMRSRVIASWGLFKVRTKSEQE